MADPSQLANKARKTLAEGLQALQTGEDLPDELLDIAEPIAVSMGLLHKIEKADAPDASMGNEALTNVRASLDALQNVAGTHPAVDAAMEAVAGSLSMLFALTKSLQGGEAPKKVSQPPPRPAKGSRPPSTKKASRPPPPPKSKGPFAGVSKTVDIQDTEAVKAEIAAAQTPQPAQAPAPAHVAPAPAAQPAPFAAPAPQAAPAPFAAPAPQAAPAPFAAPAPQAAPAPKERVPGMTDAPVPAGGATGVAVELGAHSPSNFYKGLSGNDVIDHGGIFVATYQIPKIGDAIALEMLLPGDLELHADAVVQWIRETQSGEADPGFGAKFTRISQEGRQLIYRYTRNREPMFYDDM